jgi:DNA helicase-2/ATP-dependent DNA helicase PcrA
VFGYSLHAEMPLYAKQIIEDHPDLDLHGLRLLIVDEYQDLNRCEIGMLEALSSRDIKILAVGDDDQSIYGFRMADPSGIREFDTTFPDAADYTMSVSHRCGKSILDAARIVIESAPSRAPKAPLKPADGNPDGTFEYLRFSNQETEVKGVAILIAYLVKNRGLNPSDIVVMMRADNNAQWSTPLRERLEKLGIDSTDVEQALAPLAESGSRRAIALARLVVNHDDDLAWWTVLDQTSGISPDFITRVTDEAMAGSERFATRLLRIDVEPPEGATTASLNKAREVVGEFSRVLAEVDIEGVAASENGWADWLIETMESLSIPLSDAFKSLALNVGRVTPQEEGLGHFLNQLEPVTKDQALEMPGVSIMSMNRSKGLTRHAAIVMGVEEGVVPNPRNMDLDEERRLLYVAMTRSREFLYLTMATLRTGPTAFTGSPNLNTRSRSPFFRDTPIEPRDGLKYLVEQGLVRKSSG